MQRSLTALGMTVGLVAASIGVANASSVSGDASLTAGGPTKNIIVMLRNQHTDLAAGKGHTSPRVSANRHDEAPLIANAKSKGAKNVHGLDTVNGFAATVTNAQMAALAQDPAVAGIFPDRPIAAAPVTKETPEKASAAPVNHPICPTDPSQPLLEPEALGVTNTAFADPAKASAQKIVDGTGIKVAYIADGIDINNPDFIRANGEHVFIDYKDFSGDGINAVTGGAEAFGDASSIAAQGRQVYDLADFTNPFVTNPAGCNIRVLGMAPGASLIGLKVFGNSNSAPTSRFIEAIDYAVAAGADVLNESFGGNPFPDSGNDPITLADQAAVAAGVTVVASTGDAGVTGTIGSPSSSPDVIAVGATTTFESYLQTDAAGARQFSNGTWLNNNISAISSGGVTQGNTVPDLVAPGDLGWALCTPDLTLYEECAADNGNPSGIQNFGGTSQSSPLTAGAAALVIEAYENTHHGVRPAPSLVKRILTGTAQDLGAPGFEQGAGLLNALAAVKVAESWVDPDGGQAQVGSALVVNHNQVSLSGAPGSVQTGFVTVRNVSPSTQVVKATTRAYSHIVKDVTGTIPFDVQNSPTFVDEGFATRAYVTKTFTVGHVDRLDVSAAAALVTSQVAWSLRLTLIDPSGAFAAYNIPQGGANFAHVDVRQPKAGTWTMIVASSTGGGANTFNDNVAFEITQSNAATHGTVSPSSMSLRPGQTGTFRVTTTMPSAPGDLSASVQLSDATASTSVPLNLRAIIPARDTTFSGKITGGNGRSAGGVAQSNIYYMDVPKGKRDLSIGITFSDGAQVELATLTAPDGQVLSFQSNDPFGNALQMYRRNPKPGRWVLSLETTNPVSGLETSQSFTVKVRYNTVRITAKGLPTTASTKLAAGQTVTVPVTVKNTSNNVMFYFTDGRLDQTGTISLADVGFQVDDSGTQVPIVEPMPLPQPDTTLPLWFVPTEVSQFGVTATGDQPVNLDVNYQSGEPEVYGPAVGNSATIMSTGDQVSPTFWLANVGQSGPFDGPATPGEVSFNAWATGQLFDPAIGSVNNEVFDPNFIGFLGQSANAHRAAILKRFGQRLDGKYTRSTVSKNDAAGTASDPIQVDPDSGLLILFPGETGVINVTITPVADPGTVVKGHLYVDSFGALFTDGIDELIDLPYTYTVK